jgi:hypothetical protein
VSLDRPIRTRPMTPEEVLEGLRDLHWRTSGRSWESVVEDIGFDTDLTNLPVEDMGFDAISIELYFDTGPLPPEWWQTVSEFGTVAGLCHALSRYAEVPVIEPVVVFGKPCMTAGAFAVIRSLLIEAGADVSELRPSSLLLPYVWLWPGVFRWVLPRLAPGRVPPVVFRNHRLMRRILGIMFGLGGALLGVWVANGFPVLGGFLAAVFAKVLLFDLILVPWAAQRRNWSVSFGDLHDFRDLARLIAGESEPIRTAAA